MFWSDLEIHFDNFSITDILLHFQVQKVGEDTGIDFIKQDQEEFLENKDKGDEISKVTEGMDKLEASEENLNCTNVQMQQTCVEDISGQIIPDNVCGRQESKPDNKVEVDAEAEEEDTDSDDEGECMFPDTSLELQHVKGGK